MKNQAFFVASRDELFERQARRQLAAEGKLTTIENINFAIATTVAIAILCFACLGMFEYAQAMDALAAAHMPQSVHDVCQGNSGSTECGEVFGRWAEGVLAENGLR